MFWGWFSSGNGGVRRGGGCIFLPFLFICGSFFLFDNFNSTWFVLLIVGAVLWFALSGMFNRARQPRGYGDDWAGGMFDDEKPKRDFADEKPKRSTGFLERDDGEILEVIEPADDEDDARNRLF